MKKFLAILLVMVLLAPCAFAKVTVTTNSETFYENSKGVSMKRIVGTIAMGSTYTCNGASCGEPFSPQGKLGLSSIYTWISPFVYSTTAASYVIAIAQNYVSGARDASSGADGRLILVGVSGAGLTSSVSGDYSALTAVPFEAIGTVL